MKLGILGPGLERSGYTTKRLLEEGKKEFKQVDIIPAIHVKLKAEDGVEAFYGKKRLSEYDYILPRIDSKRAIVGYPIMRFLDELGVRKPYKAETVLIAHNKFITLERLAMNGVKVPRTYLTASQEAAKEILDKEKMPIMIKLLSGFGGMGVMFIESREAAESVISTLKTMRQEIFIEEFIKNKGEDIRGIVAGDEMIASFKRIAAEGEKRSNVYSGGRAVAHKLTPEMEEIVFKSAKAIGAGICAVDMVQGKEGTYVMEVNINPGIQGIEKATDINVAQRMIGYVKSELKK